MREIIGGGESTRGICKITYRVRKICNTEIENNFKKFISGLDKNKLESFFNELRAISSPINAGIVPSICSYAMYQQKILNLVEKYNEDIHRNSSVQ